MHWILLRGLAREQAHWGDFPKALARAMQDDRFHAVDLPGTGVRFRESSPWSISKIRQEVEKQVQHIPRPYGLIALSLGGMVALDWAQSATEGTIQRLVLINTSCGLSMPWHRMRPSALPSIVRLLTRRELFDREAGILSLTSSRPVATATAKRWYSIQRQRPVSRMNAVRQLTAAARFRPAARRPLPDALVLASQGDRIVDWRCSQAVTERWQWTLQVHPSAGHDLPLDEPQWVVDQIRAHREPAP